jgi:hypothetical protein
MASNNVCYKCGARIGQGYANRCYFEPQGTQHVRCATPEEISTHRTATKRLKHNCFGFNNY